MSNNYKKKYVNVLKTWHTGGAFYCDKTNHLMLILL